MKGGRCFNMMHQASVNKEELQRLILSSFNHLWTFFISMFCELFTALHRILQGIDMWDLQYFE